MKPGVCQTLVMMATFLTLAGCSPDKEGHTAHDNHQHVEKPAAEAAPDHEHGEETSFDSDALEHIKSKRCEHGIPILECDECRYEVGAVEVAPALLDPQKDNLIGTARTEMAPRGGGLRLTGEVSFDERKVVHVTPRISGVARRVFVNLGDPVKSGARLMEIDSLELGQLRSRLLQARARLQLAQKNYEREKQLNQKHISPESDLLKAESDLQASKVEVATAREQLSLLGFSDSRLQELSDGRSGRMVVRTPIDGTVVTKGVTSGERISPEKEILTVADLSSLWVWASAYESDLAALLEATKTDRIPAKVEVAAFPSRPFSGEVDYVGATMDEATRTIKVRIVVSNPERLLRPGMFADVVIDLGQGSPALYVPDEAVVHDGDASFVFVRIGKRRFLRRDVRTGASRAGLTEITSGLSSGEEIVARGTFLLKSDILREKMGAGCAD